MSERIKGIIRLLAALVPALNIVLVALGKNPLPFTPDELTVALSGAVTFVGILWAWWKDNNMTNVSISLYPTKVRWKKNKDKVGGEK